MQEMGNNLLFSIIIPVFQVEAYLKECLTSVLPLVGSDCELILVVGKSSDRSNEIALEFAQRYDRLHIIEQSGKGLSNARNCGVHHSNGAFIIYIDSDDIIDTNNLLMLMNKIRQTPDRSDVYMSDYMQLFPSGKKKIIRQVGDISVDAGMSALPDILREKKCFWNVWRYIYRRSFLEKNNINFLENRTSEDIDYTTKVFINNPRIEFWNNPYYIYRMGRTASLMNVISLKRVEDVTTVIESSITLLDEHSAFQDAELLQEQFRFEYMLNIALIFEVGQQDRKAAFDAFCEWQSVLQPTQYVITKIYYFFMKIFGLSAGARVLLLLKKAKRRLVRR